MERKCGMLLKINNCTCWKDICSSIEDIRPIRTNCQMFLKLSSGAVNKCKSKQTNKQVKTQVQVHLLLSAGFITDVFMLPQCLNGAICKMLIPGLQVVTDAQGYNSQMYTNYWNESDSDLK